MWTYTEARDSLVEHLRRQADAQDRGDLQDIGSGFDSVDTNLERKSGSEFDRLNVALYFWDEWIYARDHRWVTSVPAQENEWPELARTIADLIETDSDIDNADVLSAFGYRSEGPAAVGKFSATAWIALLFVAAAVHGFMDVDPDVPSSMLVAMWTGAVVANISIAALVTAVFLGIRRVRKKSITLRRVLSTYTIVWVVFAFLRFASWVGGLNAIQAAT